MARSRNESFRIGEMYIGSVDSESKLRGRTFLYWLTLGFILLFCLMVVLFWYASVKSSDFSGNVQVVTKDYSPFMTRFTNPVAKSTSEVHGTNVTSTTQTPQCASIPDLEKVDCHPDEYVTEKQCISRSCCYQTSSTLRSSAYHIGVPHCYYPKDYVGYKVVSIIHTTNGLNASLRRVISSGFPNDIESLKVVISHIDKNTLKIKVTDAVSDRFEVPLYSNVTCKEIHKGERAYDVSLSPDGVLSISRRSTNVKIFTTNLSYLIYSNQFLQLTANVQSRYIYGLGEHYGSFLKDVNWTRFTFFNKDNFPGPGLNLYGSHPFYLALESNKSSHGVLLLNSNAMDITLQPTPAITYRTIGGVFDFFFFMGPNPVNVVQQYTELIGHSFMPPYWSLGFHLCKYGYNSVNETRKIYERTKRAGVPYDVQWNDIDYMDQNNDFTYDKVNYSDLPQFVDELHQEGMHYVVMFDPGVSNTETHGTYPPYDHGVNDDIFVKNATGDIFIGKVWNPVTTVFPDFTHPNATSYWIKQFKYFHDMIEFDGAWIDMNEISNFYYNGTVDGCPDDSSLENPPYVPAGVGTLYIKTLCMTAKHYSSVHYNEHNLYGYREAIATNLAMSNITGKRPFVISRATFIGQGQFSGHWSGDIASTWEDMRYSIINMLNFNLFGIPMVGSDICGFRLDTNAELCARWFALGAFYPFARNHNDINRVEQDPTALGKDVFNSAMTNLMIRYRLLPYLYYLFYRSHVYGEPVIQPLFFQYANDPDTYAIDEQFLWGSNLMVLPALYEGVSEIVSYFPEGIWYDFYSGEKRVSKGEKFTLPAPLNKLNLAIRGGSILLAQFPSNTTTASRLNGFILYVALGSSGDSFGELYWDDGESIGSYENNDFNMIEFSFHENILQSKSIHCGYNTTMNLDLIKIFGVESQPSNITVNENNATFTWNKEFKDLAIVTESVSLLQPLTVSLF